MRRADELKTQELVHIFEKAYNGTIVRGQHQHHHHHHHQCTDEIIELIKPLVDAAYDDKKRNPETIEVACERFRQQNAMVSQQNRIETDTYELMGQRWNIRDRLHRHYHRTRTDITLRQLHASLNRNSNGVDLPLDHLKMILPRLGFHVFTTRNGNELVLDEHKSRLKRIRYLRCMQTIRKQRKPIVYLGEANVNVIVGDHEVDAIDSGNARCSSMVLLYAASHDGLINFTFAHKQSHEITADNFIDWLQAVAGNLSRGTALVVETKPYTMPDARELQGPSRREVLRWLKVHDTPFDEEWTMVELRDAVRRTKTVAHAKRMTFLRGRRDGRIERVVKQMGHTLVRIPKNHPELRPFAAADFFATANVDAACMIGPGTWTAIAEMARNCIRQRLDESTADQWALHCREIVNVENKLLEFEQFVSVAENNAGDGSSGTQHDIAIVIDSSDDDT